MKNYIRNHRKGFLLVTSLLFTAILLILTLAYVARVAAEYRFMTKIYSSTAALDLAEAGVDRALWEVSYNNSTFSGWNDSTDANGNRVVTTSVNAFSASGGSVIGDYDVYVLISTDGMNVTARATGYVPNRTSPSERRVVKVAYSRHNFSRAVASLNSITMSGSAKTDSYDSSLGPYNADSADPDYNCGQEGSVATNGPINLSGNAYINGDANPGADYPFSGEPPVSGSYGTMQAPLVIDPIPPSTIDAAEAVNNNNNIIHDAGFEPLSGSALSVSGSQSITLPGGTYYFTSINVSGNEATVNVTGPSTVYVDGGNISVSGPGVVNSTGQTRNLLIYSTGSTISLSGSSAFSGAIYAPNSAVTLTGQENFYGSIVCGSNVDSGQAKIHFDLSLLNVSPVFASNKVTSWQETSQ